MSRAKFLFAFFVFALLLSLRPHPAPADILHMKSGDQFEGSVESENDTRVVFDIAGGSVTFNRSEISSIEKTAAAVKSSPAAVSGSAAGAKSGFDLKKTLSAWFPKTRKKASASQYMRMQAKAQKGSSPLPNWLRWIVAIVVPLFAQLIAIQIYLSMASSLQVSLLEAFIFLIKVTVFGLLAGGLLGFGTALLISALTGSPPNGFLIFGLYLIGYSISYYVIARKCFDEGMMSAFFMALVLWVVVAATNQLLVKVNLVPDNQAQVIHTMGGQK